MKAKKFLIICFCITFIIMSIESSILVIDYLHIEHCDVLECPLCRLITIAVNFIKDINVIYMIIFSFVLTIPLVQNIKNNMFKKINRTTLVEMKVIQNN